MLLHENKFMVLHNVYLNLDDVFFCNLVFLKSLSEFSSIQMSLMIKIKVYLFL